MGTVAQKQETGPLDSQWTGSTYAPLAVGSSEPTAGYADTEQIGEDDARSLLHWRSGGNKG
jgi:hypothetical protein